MTAIINMWFEIFASYTGILGEIRQYQDSGIWILLLLGCTICLFGFKIYRGLFSVIVFMLIALGSSMLLGGRMDWGSVVTLFAVGGIALAVLGYGWKRLGGVIVCAVSGALMANTFSTSLWVMGLAALILGGLVLVFPVITICFTTAVYGSWLFLDVLYLMLGKDTGYGIWVVLLAAAGCLLQLYMNRKQKLFSKVCPDRLRYALEKRRQRTV